MAIGRYELVEPPYKNMSPLEIENSLRQAISGWFRRYGSSDNEEKRNQVVIDTVKIVSTGLLGMSVAVLNVTIIVMTPFHKRIITECERFLSLH